MWMLLFLLWSTRLAVFVWFILYICIKMQWCESVYVYQENKLIAVLFIDEPWHIRPIVLMIYIANRSKYLELNYHEYENLPKMTVNRISINSSLDYNLVAKWIIKYQQGWTQGGGGKSPLAPNQTIIPYP